MPDLVHRDALVGADDELRALFQHLLRRLRVEADKLVAVGVLKREAESAFQGRGREPGAGDGQRVGK